MLILQYTLLNLSSSTENRYTKWLEKHYYRFLWAIFKEDKDAMGVKSENLEALMCGEIYRPSFRENADGI